MAKSAYKYDLSNEDKAIAAQNGIPIPTLYKRLQAGWDKEKAITEKPRKVKQPERDEKGEFISEISVGKVRTFQLPQEYDNQFDQLVEKSGLTLSEYVRGVIVNHLGKNPPIKGDSRD